MQDNGEYGNDSFSLQRNLSHRWLGIATFLGIIMSLFHIYTGATMPYTALIQRSVHVGFGLMLIFLIYSPYPAKLQQRPPWYDLAFVLLSVIVTGYIALFENVLYQHTIDPFFYEIVFGSIAIILVLEATRRTLGNALPIISIIFILYGLFGENLPFGLGHPGYTFSDFIAMNYLYTEGIFSSITGTSAIYLFLFLLFASMLQQFGGGDAFINLANSLFGHVRGGPAKISVVASALFGSISGSAVANVVSTGSITIPLMKKVGYNPKFAASVEAVSSTGGQLAPPIMGSAAFIMADMLGISYVTIVFAAIIPAILYYMSLFLMVDSEAVRTGIKGLSKEEVPNFKDVLIQGWYHILPLIILIYLLAVARQSPGRAAFWSIVCMIVVELFKQLFRDKKLDVLKIFDSLGKGAISALPIISAVACMGIVVSIINTTGLGLKLSGVIIGLSGGSLFGLLVLTMIASIILGMGIPTVAAYLVLAITVAPALIEMGVAPLAAHMFVFFFGILSAITPPVAVASFTAASIAGAKPMSVGWEAVRLGLVVVLIPYVFVYDPAMLMIGSPLEVIMVAIKGLLGVWMFASGLQGIFFSIPVRWLRAILFFGGIALIFPGWITDLLGVLCLGISVAVIFKERFIKETNKKFSQ